MAAPVLATTRYVEIGTYIGQFFMPGAGNLPTDVRVPCLVGRGDRNILIRNAQLRRSFVYSEQLSFTSISPFTADVAHVSDGTQAAPTRIYNSGGVEITANKWEWVKVAGEYSRVHIADTAFDPMSVYYIDYQSTSRDVRDTIPDISIQSMSATAQVREFLAVGTIQDLDEFQEYKDYFFNFELDQVEANPSNAHAVSGFDTGTLNSELAGVATGTGVIMINNGAAYSHSYDRLYSFEVTMVTGTSGTRTAEISWSSEALALGSGSLPNTPLNTNKPRSTILVDEAVPSSMTGVLVELGVILDFDFGASNFVSGDMFYLQARGPGKIELDARLLNSNQFIEFSSIVPMIDTLSTGSMDFVSLPSDYTFTDHNIGVKVECYEVSTLGPDRIANFVWSTYGTKLVNGAFTINSGNTASMTQPLGASGIIVSFSFGASHFVVGDTFNFTVKAPRIFYKGKESVRNLTFSVGAVVNGTNSAAVSGSYTTDTPEGRYGVWEADSSINNGKFELGDGLVFFILNSFGSSLVPNAGSQLATSDKFTTQLRTLGTLDFSLLTELTQTISNPAQIAVDTAGAVTGTAGARYIVLDNIPETVIYFNRLLAGTPVPYIHIPNTPFLKITDTSFSTADGDLIVLYRHRGGEPVPGQTFYVTAKYLRPAAFYNLPVLFLSQEDAKAFLAPSTTKNDLYIASEICWAEPIQGLFVIQVKDIDDDGLYSRDDFRTAINAFLQDKRATDLVVLNNFASLPDQLQIINRSSDPFENHECMTYVGAPIGTPIGSENQPGSLVFLSRKTLAVYGQNPAHGTRVLVAPTRATRTITLEDKSSTSVTLDGSFVAASIAAKVCGFTLPTDTVLLKTITAFDTMQTYRAEENSVLGAAQILYMKDESGGVFRLYEDVTTDGYSPDTKNMNQMTQKQFVTRDIRNTINTAIIGSVFPSAGAGEAMIQSLLVERLASLATSGFIGTYQDESGTERDISPSDDTLVFRDTIDPTLFHIGYNYFLATVAKRVFGLYTVSLPGGFPR